MGKNIPEELINPREDKFLKEEELRGEKELLNINEIIEAQLSVELSEISILLEELKVNFENFIDGKNLTKKEENKLRKKVIGVFEGKIKKITKKNNSDKKLEEFKAIKNDLTRISKLGMEDLVEGVESLRESALSDDKKNEKDSIISPAEVEADIEVETEPVSVIESIDQIKIIEKEEKPISPIIKKAIMDKDFAGQMMENEISKQNNGKNERERVRKEISDFIADMDSLLVEFEEKEGRFNEAFPGMDKILENIKKTKQAYQDRLEKFRTLGENDYTQKNLVEINQLHNRLCKILEIDWNQYYKEKMNLEDDTHSSVESNPKIESVEIKKASDNKNNQVLIDEIETEQVNDLPIETDKIVLEDLTDHEFEGVHSPIIDNIRKSERQKIINKYGEINDVYLKYGEGGFPMDSIVIVGYELNGPDNNFVEIEKVIKGKNVKEKLNLNEFDEYLMAGGYEREKIIESDIGSKEKLTQEEQLELQKFVEEILAKIDADLVSLKDLLKTKDVGDKIKDRISLYEENGLRKIKEIIAKDKDIFESQDIFNLVNTLHLKIRTILDNLIDEPKEEISENEEEKSIEFSEDERNKIELIEKSLTGITEKWKSEFSWGDDFPKGRIEQMLEIQTLVFLKKNFREKGWFVGKEEETAEFILKNKK